MPIPSHSEIRSSWLQDKLNTKMIHLIEIQGAHMTSKGDENADLGERTLLYEDNVNKEHEHRSTWSMLMEIAKHVWTARIYPVVLGCTGFVAMSITRFQKKKKRNWEYKARPFKDPSDAPENSTQRLWVVSPRHQRDWTWDGRCCC